MHELGHGEMPRAVLFRGTKELQKAELQSMLGLTSGRPGLSPGLSPRHPTAASPRGGGAAAGIGRYLLPVGENDFALETAIEELQARPTSCDGC